MFVTESGADEVKFALCCLPCLLFKVSECHQNVSFVAVKMHVSCFHEILLTMKLGVNLWS